MSRGIYTVSIGLLFVASQVLGCTKFEPGARASETGHEFDTDDRKVFYSKVVVYGEVMERVKGNYPYKGVKGVFTVKFNVRCTYLGGPDIPSTIYIAGLGNERGQIPECPAAPIGLSREAVMFLKPTSRHDVFETEFQPNVGPTEIILDDLSLSCGLNLTETSESYCQDFPPLSEEDGCIGWTPIVMEPKPEVTTKPEPEPEETPKPEPEETPMPESESESTEEDKDKNKDKPDDTLIDINGTDNGKNNKPDKGYETKPETEANADQVSGSTGEENGSTTILASHLVTLITVIITLIV